MKPCRFFKKPGRESVKVIVRKQTVGKVSIPWREEPTPFLRIFRRGKWCL
jgi:hypothetical protein